MYTNVIIIIISSGNSCGRRRQTRPINRTRAAASNDFHNRNNNSARVCTNTTAPRRRPFKIQNKTKTKKTTSETKKLSSHYNDYTCFSLNITLLYITFTNARRRTLVVISCSGTRRSAAHATNAYIFYALLLLRS